MAKLMQKYSFYALKSNWLCNDVMIEHYQLTISDVSPINIPFTFAGFWHEKERRFLIYPLLNTLFTLLEFGETFGGCLIENHDTMIGRLDYYRSITPRIDEKQIFFGDLIDNFIKDLEKTPPFASQTHKSFYGRENILDSVYSLINMRMLPQERRENGLVFNKKDLPRKLKFVKAPRFYTWQHASSWCDSFMLKTLTVFDFLSGLLHTRESVAPITALCEIVHVWQAVLRIATALTLIPHFKAFVQNTGKWKSFDHYVRGQYNLLDYHQVAGIVHAGATDLLVKTISDNPTKILLMRKRLCEILDR